MSTPESIIDVKPMSSVRGRTTDAAKTATDTSFRAPSYGRKTAPATDVTQATVVGETSTPNKKPSRLGGVAQTVAGGALMIVGIPLLILPGPGLLALGAGAVLATGGVKKILRS